MSTLTLSPSFRGGEAEVKSFSLGEKGWDEGSICHGFKETKKKGVVIR